MPRIRSLKPSFWGSPGHRGAHPWVRMFYQAMWNWADDGGRGSANARELHGFAFPDEEDDVLPGIDDIPRMLLEVQQRYGVKFYKVDGRRYYAITTWEKHQRVERRAESRHPAPEEGSPYDPGPGDGMTYTEYRKFRHRMPEAPAGHAGRSGVYSDRRNGAQRGPAPIARPRNDHGQTPETGPDQGIPETPVHDAGSRGVDTGSSAPVVSSLDKGNTPSEWPTDAGRARPLVQTSLLDDEPPDEDEHAVGTYDPDHAPRAELALVPAADPAPPARTQNQRVNDLATIYYDCVKKRTNFVAVRQCIKAFIDDEWTDEQIESALRALAADGWTLTKETLRRALSGPPKRSTSKPTASDRAARTLALMQPEGNVS